MAMARVCDLCGELVEAPFKQLKVLDASEEGTEPRNYKTVRSMDLHPMCYGTLDDFLKKSKAEHRKLAKVGDGVPANGGPGS